MVIFSHRGIGFGEKENTLKAFSLAINKGFSVEIDLRQKGNNIILSHDQIDGVWDLSEFKGLLNLIEENPHIFFALHLKENSYVLFKKVLESVKNYKNYFLFITDFKQDNFITADIVNKKQLALYVTQKHLDKNLVDRVDYFWMDETENNIYMDLDYFMKFNKKIICCSPEIYSDSISNSLERFKKIIIKNTDMIFGICTDFTVRES